MRRMPPGRTARRWARRRLEVADRGIEVLEQKVHALAREQRRLRHHVDDTEQAWTRASREADRWFLRAAVLGGATQFDLARPAGDADATITWRSIMGVAAPSEVRVTPAPQVPVGSLAHTSALAHAATAHRQAVVAALDHAAATRALAVVEGELAVTRRRLRGLRDGWVPRLEQALHDVELRLAEDEREDMVRSRWVGQRQGGPPT